MPMHYRLLTVSMLACSIAIAQQQAPTGKALDELVASYLDADAKTKVGYLSQQEILLKIQQGPIRLGWLARIAALEQLGRRDQAQQQRWDLFTQSLSIPHLRAYLQRLDDFADVDAEERALQLAEHHPDPLLALQFLVHWPAMPRAARLVINHGLIWDGGAFEVLTPAAERLSSGHPLAATILLRTLVLFALSSGRTRRYRHAAEHLRSCERLAAEIDDWQGLQSHATFVGSLRESFGRCWSFWQLLER